MKKSKQVFMFYNKHRNNTYFRKMADFEVKLNNIGSYTGDIQSIITSLLLETKDGNFAKVKRFQKSLKYLGYKARAEKIGHLTLWKPSKKVLMSLEVLMNFTLTL